MTRSRPHPRGRGVPGTSATGSGAEALELLPGATGRRRCSSTSGCPTATGSRRSRRCARSTRGAAVIMISGHGTATTAVKAIKMGAYDYLEKPLSYEQRHGGAARRARRAAARAGAARAAEHGRAAEPRAGACQPPPAMPLLRVGQAAAADDPPSDGALRPRASTPAAAPAWCSSRCPPTAASTSSRCRRATSIPAHVAAVGDTEYATTLAARRRRGPDRRAPARRRSTPPGSPTCWSRCTARSRCSTARRSSSAAPRGDRHRGPGRAAPRVRRSTAATRSAQRRQDACVIEPADDASRCRYLLRYPPPIGEQFYDFTLRELRRLPGARSRRRAPSASCATSR